MSAYSVEAHAAPCCHAQITTVLSDGHLSFNNPVTPPLPSPQDNPLCIVLYVFLVIWAEALIQSCIRDCPPPHRQPRAGSAPTTDLPSWNPCRTNAEPH